MPMRPPNRDDVLRMDWLCQQHGIKVERVVILPDGLPTEKQWRLCVEGMNPIHDRTLRICIDRAMQVQRKSTRKGVFNG